MDIVAIGDAIVDVIATCEDSFLDRLGFAKGSMRLLSAEEAEGLYSAMGPARETSGGSAANSMAGAAALGLRAAFVGQVADDQLGTIFAHDMRSLGVRFETPPIAAPPPTGVCLILVTPDAQRTMNTCPGASHRLSPAMLDADLIRSASVTFLEGYLWGPEQPRATMLEAARIAREAGRTIAFTLSESLSIGNRREGVIGMIDAGLVDILFGNEHEIAHLTGCSKLADGLAALAPKVRTLVATRGEAGAVGFSAGASCEVRATPVAKVVDTTGAGDQFAAGFLYGLTHDMGFAKSGKLAGLCAAEVISHYGARPEVNLRKLAADNGLI